MTCRVGSHEVFTDGVLENIGQVVAIATLQSKNGRPHMNFQTSTAQHTVLKGSFRYFTDLGEDNRYCDPFRIQTASN